MKPSTHAVVEYRHCLVAADAAHHPCFQVDEGHRGNHSQSYERLLVKHFFLDISTGWRRIKVSPPIRFRIEWARGQGIVTAPWQRAHFNSVKNHGRGLA